MLDGLSGERRSFMTPAERITNARGRLILDHPWFGALALRLRVVEDDRVDADGLPVPLSTDGTALHFNPAGIADWTSSELLTGIGHEVLHCAMLHPYRGQGTDWDLWNVACDYAVNELLAESGFTLHSSGLRDPQFRGMSAEQVYAILKQSQRDGDGRYPGKLPGGSTTMDPGKDPSVKPSDSAPGAAGGDAGKSMTAEDWQMAAEQAAMVGRKAGTMGGGVDRAVKEARQSRTDWRAILREFVEAVIPSDYSYQQPNRAYLATGLYLPGVIREGCPRLAVGVDTSGSIDAGLLAAFAAELDGILHECRPAAIDVAYCDATVAGTDHFEPDDGPVVLRPMGGGGTAFQPVLDHFSLGGDPPAALVYFTDLCGPTPTEPDYPVLWITSMASSRVGPFGRTVRAAF